LDLSDLLTHSLPAMPTGRGRMALLTFLLNGLKTPSDWQPSVEELNRWNLVLAELAKPSSKPSSPVAPEEAELAAQVLTAMKTRWPVWGEGLEWGWAPLFGAVQGFSFKQARLWLNEPEPPSSKELSERLFSFTSNGKSSPNQVTLLGAMLWSSQAPSRADELFSGVEMLLKAGVDPSVRIDSWDSLALDVSPSADISGILVNGTARTHKRMAFGWLDAKMTFPAIQSRLSGLLELCRSNDASRVLPALKVGFPELVERFAMRLARHVPTEPALTNPKADWMQSAKQVRALGRLVGEDCWNPQEGGISLAGAWARASVIVSSDPNFYGSRHDRFSVFRSAMMVLPCSVWGGQAFGLPARVWGQMAYSQEKVQKPEWRQALQVEPAAWDNLSSALRAFPSTVQLWRMSVDWGSGSHPPEALTAVRQAFGNHALSILVPGSWKPEGPLERQAALFGALSSSRNLAKETFLRLAKQEAFLVMKGLLPASSGGVERSLALHALSGFKDPGGIQQLARWCQENRIAVRLDRVRAAVDSSFTVEPLGGWTSAQRAAALELFIEPVNLEVPSRTPRF